MEFQLDTDNKEFQDALQLITHTRQSVFLTGKAGTGKSTFLKYICAHTKKKYVVLAPTGIAAINAEGVTLHSFFKLPFRPMLPDDPDLSLKNGRIFEFFKYRKEHRKLISEVELIIIDEISMVGQISSIVLTGSYVSFPVICVCRSEASNCCLSAMSSSWSRWSLPTRRKY